MAPTTVSAMHARTTRTVKRRVAALITLASLGLVVACATPALAAGDTKPSTTVRDLRVTPRGQAMAPGATTSAPVVPDHTNLVGVQWAGDAAAKFTVEVRGNNGRWTLAGKVSEADGGPDPGTTEALRAQAHLGNGFATEPLQVDDPAKVRVRVESGAVQDVRVVAVASPPAPTADRAPARALQLTGAGGAFGAVLALGLVIPRERRRRWPRRPTALLLVLVTIGMTGAVLVDRDSPASALPGQPRIISRGEWGADESLRLRNCPEGPSYAVPRLAVIHHTVNSNSYTPSGAISLVRSIYAYHTVGRGYCDIGYNFLVDRFGRIYEGRYGGITQGVIGAHATLFNTNTFGVAMIGDFSSAVPGPAIQNALISLLVWKMSLHRMNPNYAVERYGALLDPILGHTDAGRVSGDGTACPGWGGYSILPALRAAARAYVQYGDPIGSLEKVVQSPGKVQLTGWAIDPETPNPIALHVYVDGNWRTALNADLNRADVGRVYSWLGARHGFKVTFAIPPGTHQICVYGISVLTGINPQLGCGSTSGRPIGNIDSAVRDGTGVRLRGWVLDPDTSASILLHVYVDEHYRATGASTVSRPDVAIVFPGYGPLHGFDTTVTLTPGKHRVCVWGISQAADPNTQVRCRNV